MPNKDALPGEQEAHLTWWSPRGGGRSRAVVCVVGWLGTRHWREGAHGGPEGKHPWRKGWQDALGDCKRKAEKTLSRQTLGTPLDKRGGCLSPTPQKRNQSQACF